MAALTYFDGHLMAIVPRGTVAESARTVAGHDEPRDVLVLPPGQQLPAERATRTLLQPGLRMASSNNPGIIFAVTLCLVIVVSNIHLRGLWSVVAILSVALGSVLLAWLGWWDGILGTLGMIDIHINALGYVVISVFLFAIWSPQPGCCTTAGSTRSSAGGQLRVRTALGGGETTFDTMGMRVEKHRDDLFRHWLLGFGSGDLTVKTSGSNAYQLEIPNVLQISHKLELIRRMLQDREVVSGKP